MQLIDNLPTKSIFKLSDFTLNFLTDGFKEEFVRIILDKAETEKQWDKLYDSLESAYRWQWDTERDAPRFFPRDKLPEWFRNLKNPFTPATPNMEEMLALLEARGIAPQQSVQQQTSEEEAKQKELAHKLTPYFITSDKEADALYFVKKIWGLSPSIIADEVATHVRAQEIAKDFNKSKFCKALKEYEQYEPKVQNFIDSVNRRLKSD